MLQNLNTIRKLANNPRSDVYSKGTPSKIRGTNTLRVPDYSGQEWRKCTGGVRMRQGYTAPVDLTFLAQ